jgi:pterin-4a-carbinolamine dehydratase
VSSNKETNRAIEELDNRWEVKEGKIVKSFQLPCFMKAIDFVNDVAKIGEGQPSPNYHNKLDNCQTFLKIL